MKKLCTILISLLILLTGCNNNQEIKSDETKEDFIVGMECNYAPFNWTSPNATDTSIKVTDVDYCDGYDVMIARRIADDLNRNLVVKPIIWDGLINALTNDEIDAIIAGMTDTPKRREGAEFTNAYYTSEMVMIVRKDDPLANATSIQDFSGKKVLGQINTLYDDIIDQIENVQHMTPQQSYPRMVLSLSQNEVDALTAELPVAQGVIASNNNLAIVRFDKDKGFKADTSVSIAVKKGNMTLLNDIQNAIDKISEDERNEMMTYAANFEDDSSNKLLDFKVIKNILKDYGPTIRLGIQNTLLVSFIGTIIGLLIGLLVGGIKAIKLDHNANNFQKIIKKLYDILATIYIEVFRGTPMMIQAVFIYYALLKIVGWTPLIASIFIISINTGAYMSEIIRAGIQSINIGQIEAARSLGMSNLQTIRLVVLPQAIKNAFPAIGNEFIVNIKDSSVLSVITLTELAFQTNRIAGSTLKYTEAYFITACVYLTITLLTSFILRQIEKKMLHHESSIPQSITNDSLINQGE